MLTIRHLSFAFGSRVLFKDISFQLTAGSIVRLAGPNGVGKSTLLSIVTGLQEGASGEVDFSFANSSDRDPRSQMAWLPPDANALHGSFSATQNLKFWLELRGIHLTEEDLSAHLKMWGLGSAYTARHLDVARFSTGMKRRLALARLCLLKVPLWLLDEPLFGLDDKACALFKGQLERHVQSGGSAIVITHDERLLAGLRHQTITLGGV